jgi:hypothetical protein
MGWFGFVDFPRDADPGNGDLTQSRGAAEKRRPATDAIEMRKG